MNKKELSKRNICTKYITPAIVEAGWKIKTQIREEISFTDGQTIVQGKLYVYGKRKRADYIMYYKPNIPIAIIEAKDNNHPICSGMQQALDYAEILHFPFVFTSNEDSFVLHDKTLSDVKVEMLMSLCDKLETEEQQKSTTKPNAYEKCFGEVVNLWKLLN